MALFYCRTFSGFFVLWFILAFLAFLGFLVTISNFIFSGSNFPFFTQWVFIVFIVFIAFNGIQCIPLFSMFYNGIAKDTMVSKSQRTKGILKDLRTQGLKDSRTQRIKGSKQRNKGTKDQKEQGITKGKREKQSPKRKKEGRKKERKGKERKKNKGRVFLFVA